MAKVRLQLKLSKRAEAIKNASRAAWWRPVLQRVGEIMRFEMQKEIIRQFKVQGDPKWKKLSEAYAKLKSQLKPGRKILVFSGDMRTALTRNESYIIDKELSGVNVVVAVRDSEISERISYHMNGTPRMPKRPMIPKPRSKAMKNIRKAIMPKVRELLIGEITGVGRGKATIKIGGR